MMISPIRTVLILLALVVASFAATPVGAQATDRDRAILEAIQRLEERLAEQERMLAEVESAAKPDAGEVSAPPAETDGGAGEFDLLWSEISWRIQGKLSELRRSLISGNDVMWLVERLGEGSFRDRILLFIAVVGGMAALAIAVNFLVAGILAGRRGRMLAASREPQITRSHRKRRIMRLLLLDLVPKICAVIANLWALDILRETGVTVPGSPIDVVGQALSVSHFASKSLLTIKHHTGDIGRAYTLEVDGAIARRVSGWLTAIIIVSIYGYLVAIAASQIGLTTVWRALALRIVFLVVTLLAIRMILLARPSVAERLSGGQDVTTGNAIGPLVGALAQTWHFVAIFYVTVGYFMWAFQIEGGTDYLGRATLGSLGILLASRLVLDRVASRAARGWPVSQEWAERFPVLDSRLQFYHRAGLAIVRVAVVLVTALALLDAWGLDTTLWVLDEIGRAIAPRLTALVSIGAVGLAIWELVNLKIERFLDERDENGKKIPRSARVRTLLPFVRNAFMILWVTIVGLVLLSELGVDIAPLLAGAGVIGVALGFGAQTLVRDVITGMFILFENTIEVGDLVAVGDHSGVVDSLTMRTLRMRDMSGVVHTVPFSEIATIKNFTRDFSYAMFLIDVDKHENAERVLAVIKEVGDQMQGEKSFAASIIAPIDVMGVEGFSDFAMTVRARIKTKPLRHRRVARAFNLRMKKRFDELGIRLATPRLAVPDRLVEAPPASGPVLAKTEPAMAAGTAAE